MARRRSWRLWPWLWGRHPKRMRARQFEESAGRIRQEAAFAFAELRHQRRSLDGAIRQLEQTQAERGEENE